jgi:hypothetical protein
MNEEQVAGLIRHVLTTAGGIAVAIGWTDDGTVAAIAGAVATIAGIAWSIWAKRRPKTK